VCFHVQCPLFLPDVEPEFECVAELLSMQIGSLILELFHGYWRRDGATLLGAQGIANALGFEPTCIILKFLCFPEHKLYGL
jgi:hypothetical protein